MWENISTAVKHYLILLYCLHQPCKMKNKVSQSKSNHKSQSKELTQRAMNHISYAWTRKYENPYSSSSDILSIRIEREPGWEVLPFISPGWSSSTG